MDFSLSHDDTGQFFKLKKKSKNRNLLKIEANGNLPTLVKVELVYSLHSSRFPLSENSSESVR